MQRIMHDAACFSDLLLDEWGAGELDVDTAAQIEAHVAQCAHCNARHAAFDAVRTAFLHDAPSFRALADRVESAQVEQVTPASGQANREPRRRPLLTATTGFGIIALAALVLLMVHGPGLDTPGVRTKGGAHLDFFVKRGKRVERGVRGSTLRPGDAMRFAYTSPEDCHLAIFDLDARTASVFFPSGPRSAPVRAGSEIALDFSVELDDEPGDEWIHALFCRMAFEVEPLRAALAEKRGLSIPNGCQLDVIPISKALRK